MTRHSLSEFEDNQTAALCWTPPARSSTEPAMIIPLAVGTADRSLTRTVAVFANGVPAVSGRTQRLPSGRQDRVQTSRPCQLPTIRGPSGVLTTSVVSSSVAGFAVRMPLTRSRYRPHRRSHCCSSRRGRQYAVLTGVARHSPPEPMSPPRTPTPPPAANAGGIELGRVGTLITESAVPSADGRVTVSPLHVVRCRRFGRCKWTVPVA